MERIDEKELKGLIRVHMIWSNTSGKAGVRLYLCDKDLSGFDLSGYDLDGAVMEEVNFTSSKFVNTMLNDAHLVLSIFNNADLTNAKLSKANMNKILCLSGIFTNCKAIRTTFYEANLKGADFTNAELSGASFSKANLEGCNFNNANLRATVFNEARLYNTSFKGATGLEEIYVNQSIDIGPEGSPIILEGEKMKEWLREQAAI